MSFSRAPLKRFNETIGEKLLPALACSVNATRVVKKEVMLADSPNVTPAKLTLL